MEFRILGPLEVTARDRPLPLGGRRQCALLASLLLHANEVVSADRLVDELWGERAPPTAAKMLHVYVSRLRKALDRDGPEGSSRDVLVTASGGYLLRVGPGALDAERFAALADEGRRALAENDPGLAASKLREALALWRGPALADLAYVSFAQGEIARLDEARLAALEDRIEADLACGRHGAVVGELRALVGEHPLRERLAGQLMLALYRSGRQAEALEIYQRARATLVSELGLEPGAALRGRQEGILRQDEALQAPPRADLPGSGTTTVPATARAQRRGPSLAAAALAGAACIVAGVLVLAHGSGAGAHVAPNMVAVIDPSANRIVASVPVGTRPAALSYGAGALWVANLDDDSVSRIDPEARSVARTIATGEAPAGLAAGEGGVWVASPNGALRRIDPAFDVVSKLATGTRGYLTSVDLPSPAIVGAGAVWVVNKTTVTRIDGRTGQTVATVGVGLSPAGLAVGDGAVWVADSSEDTVTRIDVGTDTATTTPVGHGASAVAVGAGAVWVADSSDNAVVRIDPETNAVTDTIPVGQSPTGIAVGAGSVWVANSDSGTISRIDPATNTVAATIAIGNSPNSILFTDGELWVSVQANALGSPANLAGGAGNVARFDIRPTATCCRSTRRSRTRPTRRRSSTRPAQSCSTTPTSRARPECRRRLMSRPRCRRSRTTA